MTGAGIALLAGVGLGVFQILNRKASSGIRIEQGTTVLLAVSSLVLAGLILATRPLSVLASVPPESVTLFAAAGAIHFIGGWSLLSLSQHAVGAGRTGSLIGTAPVFSAVLGALFLGEFLSLPAIAGLVMVVSGVILVSHR